MGETAPAAAVARHQPSQQVADLYWQGRYNVERRSPESLNCAVRLFDEAIRRDPLYAEVYAGLASAHLPLREYAGGRISSAWRAASAAAENCRAGLADWPRLPR